MHSSTLYAKGAVRGGEKRQTTIYKIMHRKLRLKKKQTQKSGMNSGSSEGWVIPAALVAPVVT
jgi:hypothetical protein